MRSSLRIVSGLIIFACTLFLPAAEARADGIEITSGTWGASRAFPLVLNWHQFGYDMRGDGVRMRGSESDAGNQPVNIVGCFACKAGDTFYLAHPGGLFARLATQSLELNGQTHVGWNQGTLHFASESFVLPPASGDLITLTGHFTMTGSVTFDPYIYVNPVDLPPFLVGDVYGSGTVTLQFTRYQNAYYLSNIRYEFQQTPEPATLILLGSGLAGLAARHRRRRSLRRRTN